QISEYRSFRGCPRDPGRRPRWAVPTAVMLGIALGGVALAPTPEPNPCEQIAREVDVHWNRASRNQVTTSLAAAGQPPVFIAGIVNILDRHAASWRSAAPKVCALARRRGPLSGAPRMACLDGRREALATYVESLASPDAALLDRAPKALASWRVSDCANAGSVGPELASLTESDARRLNRAVALFRMGLLQRAEQELPPPGSTKPTESSILDARSALIRGWIARERNEPDSAQAHYFEALLAALTLDDPATQIQARLGLADTDLALEGQTQRARAELEQATTLLARHEDADLRRDAALLWVDVFMLEEEPLRALEHLDAWFSPLPPDAPLDPTALEAMLRRVGLLVAVGRYADAVKSGRAAATNVLEALGAKHPLLAEAKAELAIALAGTGELDAALEQAQHAVDLLDSTPHPDTFVRGLGHALNALGMTHWRREELEDARRAFERCMASTDPRSPDYGITLDNLGTILLHSGEPEGAERIHRRAIELMSAVRGEQNFEVALAYNNLGEALYQQQRYQEAHDAFSEGLHRNERARGLQHPENAAMLMGIGKTLMKRERFVDAIAPLRRAVALREDHREDRQVLGIIRYALAIAVWRGPGDIAEATLLVRNAAADFEAADLPTGDLERARTWLHQHGNEPR
ncbi:MAG: tetratricopeptide repeat protein, partial [Nannocystaceae bacterium]|nr:tetratricopeptide repeat protein [Nannocystaceae bacterium]